jgi:hypothetical protein
MMAPQSVQVSSGSVAAALSASCRKLESLHAPILGRDHVPRFVP